MRISRSRGGDRMGFGERMNVGVIRANGEHYLPGMPPVQDGFQPLGWLNIQLFDSRGREKSAYQFRNLVVNQGKNDILTVYFADGTPKASTSWFMSLIDSTGFTSIQATDTISSHAGWSEFSSYSQSTRPLWGQAAPSAGVTTITNASPVTFDITASGTLKGGFIVSNSTKGGTTGILWAAALFTTAVPVNNGDQMKCTYNLSC